MARCGTQTLLYKYNNPTLRSCRILINSKAYYHPYDMDYLGQNNLTLVNTTRIGSATFTSYRDQSESKIVYKTKNYYISFVHSSQQHIGIYVSIYTNKRDIAIYQEANKFVTNDTRVEFQQLAASMINTTLSETYRLYLPVILSLIEI